MSQVMNVEPECPSRNRTADKKSWRYPAIGTPEHTALVDAIKLNFPEIYDHPNASGIRRQYGEPVALSSAIQPPPWA